MKLNIKDITSAISKVTAITSSDKQVPGVLLRSHDDSLDVCYTNGHKAMFSRIPVVKDEGEADIEVVVDYKMLTRAIDNCQPSGIIKVNDIEFKFNDNSKMSVRADLFMEVGSGNSDGDTEGSEVEYKKISDKCMDLHTSKLDESPKTAVLNRVNYSNIFGKKLDDSGTPVDVEVAEVDREEFLDKLKRLAVEKGKDIYLSANEQLAFVNNTSYLSIFNYTVNELPLEEKDALRGEIMENIKTREANGEFANTPNYNFDEQLSKEFKAALVKKEGVIKYSGVIGTDMANSIVSIFNNSTDDKIKYFTDGHHCNIYTGDFESPNTGIWFEMAHGSKVHLGAMGRFASMKFRTYQTRFLREFLESAIKGAFSSIGSTDINIEFKQVEETGEITLNFVADASSKSISDNFKVIASDIIDPTDNIIGRKFKINAGTFVTMLSQLKTYFVALDFDEDESGTVCIRISEIIDEKLASEYQNARTITEDLCKQQGLEFIPDKTPTPIEIKLNIRDKCMGLKQYALLSK